MQALCHEEHEGQQMFDPLMQHLDMYQRDPELASNAIENYMYMQHDTEGTYYYRHFWTQEYVLIESKFYSIIAGEMDYGSYGGDAPSLAVVN